MAPLVAFFIFFTEGKSRRVPLFKSVNEAQTLLYYYTYYMRMARGRVHSASAAREVIIVNIFKNQSRVVCAAPAHQEDPFLSLSLYLLSRAHMYIPHTSVCHTLHFFIYAMLSSSFCRRTTHICDIFFTLLMRALSCVQARVLFTPDDARVYQSMCTHAFFDYYSFNLSEKHILIHEGQNDECFAVNHRTRFIYLL